MDNPHPTCPPLPVYKTPTYRTEFGRRSLIATPGHCWPGVLFHAFLDWKSTVYPKQRKTVPEKRGIRLLPGNDNRSDLELRSLIATRKQESYTREGAGNHNQTYNTAQGGSSSKCNCDSKGTIPGELFIGLIVACMAGSQLRMHLLLRNLLRRRLDQNCHNENHPLMDRFPSQRIHWN